ncbi:MAG: hypothetical protein HC854_01820 [Flavobacterium sp.]|nr:hypothetical protein [Flavobacterium sp.]
MENSKIILVIILIATIFSCRNKKSSYIEMENDIYKRNDTLFIKKTVPNMNKEGNSLYHFSHSIILDGEERNLKNFIDLNTFSMKRINNTKFGTYYKDKNYLYIYNESPLYFPDLNAIKYNNDNIKFLGYDYFIIDNKIYFQSLEVKNANPKTFTITDSTNNGYYYARDDSFFYYKRKTNSKN